MKAVSLLSLAALLAVFAMLASPFAVPAAVAFAPNTSEVGDLHKVETVEATAKIRGEDGEVITMPAAAELTFEVTDSFCRYTTLKLVEGYVEIDGKKYVLSEGWAVSLSRGGVKAISEAWGPDGSSHFLIRASDTGETGEEGVYMKFRAGFKCEDGKYLITGKLLRYKLAE